MALPLAQMCNGLSVTQLHQVGAYFEASASHADHDHKVGPPPTALNARFLSVRACCTCGMQVGLA